MYIKKNVNKDEINDIQFKFNINFYHYSKLMQNVIKLILLCLFTCTMQVKVHFYAEMFFPLFK